MRANYQYFQQWGSVKKYITIVGGGQQLAVAETFILEELIYQLKNYQRGKQEVLNWQQMTQAVETVEADDTEAVLQQWFEQAIQTLENCSAQTNDIKRQSDSVSAAQYYLQRLFLIEKDRLHTAITNSANSDGIKVWSGQLLAALQAIEEAGSGATPASHGLATSLWAMRLAVIAGCGYRRVNVKTRLVLGLLMTVGSRLKQQRGAKITWQDLYQVLGEENIEAIIDEWQEATQKQLADTAMQLQERSSDKSVENYYDAMYMLNYLCQEKRVFLDRHLLTAINGKGWAAWRMLLGNALSEALNALEADNLKTATGRDDISANKIRCLRQISAYVDELHKHYLSDDKQWFKQRGLRYGGYAATEQDYPLLAEEILQLDKWTYKKQCCDAKKMGKKPSKLSALANLDIVSADVLATNYLPLLLLGETISMESFPNSGEAIDFGNSSADDIYIDTDPLANECDWLVHIVGENFSQSLSNYVATEPLAMNFVVAVQTFVYEELSNKITDRELIVKYLNLPEGENVSWKVLAQEQKLSEYKVKQKAEKTWQNLQQQLVDNIKLALPDFIVALSSQDRQVLEIGYGKTPDTNNSFEQIQYEVSLAELEQQLQGISLNQAFDDIAANFWQIVAKH